MVQRKWPVWQLFIQSVDLALSSGARLSFMIPSSYEHAPYIHPRSRIDVCRLCDLPKCFYSEHVIKMRLELIIRLRDTLIVKSWRTAYFFKSSKSVFWLSKVPTCGDCYISTSDQRRQDQDQHQLKTYLIVSDDRISISINDRSSGTSISGGGWSVHHHALDNKGSILSYRDLTSLQVHYYFSYPVISELKWHGCDITVVI